MNINIFHLIIFQVIPKNSKRQLNNKIKLLLTLSPLSERHIKVLKQQSLGKLLKLQRKLIGSL